MALPFEQAAEKCMLLAVSCCLKKLQDPYGNPKHWLCCKCLKAT